MQKLKQRTERNTPTNASQVRGNCDLQLNKEETLSVADSKTRFNNPEVNQLQHTGGLKANVYVIGMNGEKLMPCSNAKCRRLLKSKRAHIIKMYPFTIRLYFICENQVQEVSLGIDSGYSNVGFSAVTTKKEVFSGTLILDGRTSSRLIERLTYRKLRRSKLWYRKPRFLNRRNKKEGWLPPSIQRKYDAHLKLISLARSILPISKATIETANFDIAKIENPEIAGTNYQKGDLYGYQNMRSYLIAREKGLCQLCKKEFTKGNPSHIHHCKQRNESGSNRAKNLALLHKKCHVKLHKKNLKLSAPKEYKASTFMSIINKKFQQDIPDAKITFGYITFIDKNKLNMEKSHFNDAFVISNGSNQERCNPFSILQKHRNNRAIQLNRKGFVPAIRKQRYAIQPKDLVWIDNKKCIVSGMHKKGKCVMTINSKKSFPIKNIHKVYNFGNFAFN